MPVSLRDRYLRDCLCPFDCRFARRQQYDRDRCYLALFNTAETHLLFGTAIGGPFILYQVWAFIAPGLYQHEKQLAAPLLVSSVLLFFTGMAFAYFLVLPMLFNFTMGIQLEGVSAMTDITKYLDLVLHMFFAFGFAFEIPVATVLLIHAGVVTPEGLAEKRRYIIVGCFVVGMLLTPPDVFSQAMLAIPMWMLFEAGLFFGRQIKKRSQARETADNPPD